MSYKPRIRSIKPELWTDQDLQLLSVEIRLLFIGLFSHADDEGRLEGHPSIIRSRIFPADSNVNNRKVDHWLHALEQHGFISLYDHAGRPFIQVCNWAKHQKINRPTPSEIPSLNSQHSLNGHVPISEPSVSDHGALTE